MTEVPEWVCMLVGRLVLENEALRQELSQQQNGEDEG